MTKERLMAAVMIGVDPHKGSHTAVAIGAAEGPLGELRVRASAAQAQRLVAWAADWPERTWAVEGARGLGHLLAQQLLAAGERVVDVQPKLGARVRLLTRLRRRGDRWPANRTACLVAGLLCVAAAVLPPISSHDESFPVHVAQHLLLGMTGPAFLALSAPVTVALRTLPRRQRRALLRLLHSRPAAVLSAPATAVLLDIGGLYVLYLTGLYRTAERNDLVHAAVHLHMFLAGCLLSWAVIGIDPIRRRPGIKVRLAALVIGAAGHDTLAKLMYAHNLPAGGGSITGRHVGAELMYYGGTIIGLALAIIMMTRWYQLTGRELSRTPRRIISRPDQAIHAADRAARPR
jgi:putative membrane protein